MSHHSFLVSQNIQFPRCIWREQGNPDAPQCNGRVEAQHRTAVCCSMHGAAYRYVSKETRAALKAAAAKKFDGVAL